MVAWEERVDVVGGGVGREGGEATVVAWDEGGETRVAVVGGGLVRDGGEATGVA